MAIATSCHNLGRNSLCGKMNVEMVDFDVVYEQDEYLNGGTYGKVYKCRKRIKGEEEKEYAVKIQEVCFDGGEESTYEKTLDEANIWSSLNHVNIVKLYQCFLQGNQFYFVMELIQGGNLFEEILKKCQYTEKDACLYMKQVLNALSYLHDHGIFHRDVKPDNIMLCDNTQYGSTSLVKLTDFGLARRLTHGERHIRCTPSGAPLYLAPETVMEVALGFPVDVWACGVILYILLYGAPPFWSEDTNQLFLDIVGTEVDYTYNENDISVSFLGKDLIQEMLVKDQSRRITASDALEHPWFVQGDKLSTQHRRSTLEHLCLFKNSVYDVKPRLKNRQREFNE